MEDQPAGTKGAPLATVDAIIDRLLGFDAPSMTPTDISVRSLQILGFSSESEARALAHALGLADQSLAERGVQAALAKAEDWLVRAPVPLLIFQSGRAQIPKGIEADLRDFLRDLAQSKKTSARRGRYVLAWSRDRRCERFRMFPLRDGAEVMISVCRSYPPRISRPSTAAATAASMGWLAPGLVFRERLDCERLKLANPGSSERCSAAFANPHPFASNSSRASS